MNKGGIIGFIAFVIIILLAGFFLFLKFSPVGECQKDSDCIKVQTTCCPCSMNGEEKCVHISEKENYEKIIENCSQELICAAVYKCQINSCRCIKGKCQ